MIAAILALTAAACGGSEAESDSGGAAPSSSSTSEAATTLQPSSSTTEPVSTTEARPAGFVDFEAPTVTELDLVQVSTGMGHSLEYRPDACIIAHNTDTGGSAGSIYGPQFGLQWTTEEEGFTLGWNYGDGTVQGTVTAEVDGEVVTFEGEIDGVAIRGTAYCYEGIG